MEDDFHIGSGDKLKRQPGGWQRTQPKLDPAKVPEPIRHLLPAAEKWGVSDDILREDLLARIPRSDLEQLASELQKVQTILDEWLAGPDADADRPSREYLAFSALRMLVLSL